MGVSKNNGTPKSSILIGFSLINHPFGGTTIFGNTQMEKENDLNQASIFGFRVNFRGCSIWKGCWKDEKITKIIKENVQKILIETYHNSVGDNSNPYQLMCICFKNQVTNHHLAVRLDKEKVS